MKKIVHEKDPIINIGNTSITTDDLLSILRTHAEEHEITAEVGELYEDERYEFDSFSDIDKHQSLLAAPLRIYISDVTVIMNEYGTRIQYKKNVAPLAEQLSNSLKRHRRWTEPIQSDWAPFIISFLAGGIALWVKPDIFDSFLSIILLYLPVAVISIAIAFMTKRSIIRWSGGQSFFAKHKPLILITILGAILSGLVSQLPIGELVKSLYHNPDETTVNDH